MLKLHHNLFPHLPELTHRTHTMQLSPVESESDELIRAIEEEHNKDTWQFDVMDGQSLAEFWTEVEGDIKKDPTWFTFVDD